VETEPDVLALIDRLSERVAALESGASAGVTARDDGDDPLWLLNGIKQRVPSPGAVFFAGAVQTIAGPVEWQVGLPTERILEDEWSTVAGSIAALGNPVRLSLLHAVIGGATSVAQLSEGEGMGTTGQIYHHLNQLVAHGWLSAGGRGHYAIPGERVVPLLVILSAARRTM
jgi:hypothetical protein